MSSNEYQRKVGFVIAELKSLGFEVLDRTGRKHHKYRITTPEGVVFDWTVSSTPSDRRAILNTVQPLRRFLKESGFVDARRYLRIHSGGTVGDAGDKIFALLDELAMLGESACEGSR